MTVHIQKEIHMGNHVQNVTGMQGMNKMGLAQHTPLTDDQKNKIQEILSQYDPENITSEDARSIFEQFREAGIRPARGMKDAIEAAGFDAEKLRSLGMPEDGMQGPPSGGKTQAITLSSLKMLQSILSQYDLSNLSSEQEGDLLSKLNSAGFMQPGDMINLSA
jgi:hypothetical protein